MVVSESSDVKYFKYSFKSSINIVTRIYGLWLSCYNIYVPLTETWLYNLGVMGFVLPSLKKKNVL